MPETEEKWSIQKLIAHQLAKNPGMTALELSHAIGIPSAFRRLPEIKKLGLARCEGKRKCSVSGKTAKLWFIDDREPEPDRGLSAGQEMRRLRSENERLKAKIEELEKELAHEGV